MDETLKKLIEKGVLTEEQVREVMLTELNTHMTAAATTFHSLLCSNPHEHVIESLQRRNEGTCYFYVEAQLDNPWETPDHKLWLKETIRIMKEVGLVLPDELGNFVEEIVYAVKGTDLLVMKYPQAWDLLKRILKKD